MSFFRILPLLLVLSCANDPQNNSLPDRPEENILQNIAFTHVNVVSMQDEAILSDQTVLIEDGVITKVGKDISVSEEFYLIDGTNQYLMPGLADMHTHVYYQEDLIAYLANGVTTILNMGSPASILEFRTKTAARMLPGPTIYASAFVDGTGNRGWLIRTPEEAVTDIAQIKSMGWDFIKVYNSLTKEVFISIKNEAAKHKLAIIGHGVREPGMDFIVSNGQVMIAHMEEFLYTSFANSPDEPTINNVITTLREAGTYVTPNLSAYEAISKQWGNKNGLAQLMRNEGNQYVSSKWKTFWEGIDYTSNIGSIQSNYEFLGTLTKKFNEAGIPLLLGTDSPYIPGLPNGYSIHDDLRNMVQVGLSPYEALKAGTKAPGEFITKYVPESTSFGLVKEGYRADLILLTANPLDNVENIKKRTGVMSAGRWTSEKWLQANLEEIRNKH
jgi:hypothetical protein